MKQITLNMLTGEGITELAKNFLYMIFYKLLPVLFFVMIVVAIIVCIYRYLNWKMFDEGDSYIEGKKSFARTILLFSFLLIFLLLLLIFRTIIF